MRTDGIRLLASPLATVVAAGALTGLARAQVDTFWQTPPPTGLWTNPANWTNGAPLNPGFNAHINAVGNTYVVTLDQTLAINNFEMLSAEATLTLAAAALTVQGSYLQQASRATGGPGSAIIVAGGTTLRNAALQDLPSFAAQGTLLIDGPGDTSILNTLLTHTGTTGTWQGTGNIVFGGGAGASGLSLGGTSTLTITNNQSATWNNAGTRPDLINAGTLDKNGGAGLTSFTGVRLNNTGTVRAGTGTLRFDTVGNVAAGVLTGGTWRVQNNANLDFAGQNVTTNRATVELDGADSTFAAINGLQTNDTTGTLRLLNGRQFVAPASFTNNGTIDLQGGSVVRVTPGNTFASTGGTVSGSGQTSLLLVEGTADLQGGALTGMTFMSRGPLRLRGPATILIDDTCFDHGGLGGATWDGTGGINVGGGSVMTFGPGSTLAMTNQQTMAWNNVGVRPTLSIEGTLSRNSTGTSSTITGVEVANLGTVLVQSGTLQMNTVQNVVGNTLVDGKWEVRNTGTLDFAGLSVTTNRARIILDGPTAVFTAISGLTVNDPVGQLDVKNGKTYTTAGNFTNDGTVTVTGATGPALFKIAPGSTLTNYDAGTQTITGGTFLVSGSGRDSGTVEIDGLDIATLAAAVTLDGAGANIVDPTAVGDTSALRNLALIADAGLMQIASGKNFDTSADLSVAGEGALGVGVGSTFTTNGDLGNIDPAGLFSDGSFSVGGTFRADNALIVTLANRVTLDGVARFERPDGAGGFINAFPTLEAVAPTGRLSLRNGHNLTLSPHDLSSAEGSEITIGPVAGIPADTILRVQGSFTQGGSVLVDGGRLRVDATYNQNGLLELTQDGSVSVGGPFNNNGLLRGNGTIITGAGTLLVNNGVIEPGGSPGLLRVTGQGDLQMGDTGVIRIEIAGLIAGEGFDQLWIDGRMLFEGGVAGRLEVVLDPGFTPEHGQRFEILRYDDGRVGWFEEMVIPSIFERVWETDRFVLVVPSPGIGALTALAGLVALRRRR